jgi:energy-coupling factor transport system permease protein
VGLKIVINTLKKSKNENIGVIDARLAIFFLLFGIFEIFFFTHFLSILSFLIFYLILYLNLSNKRIKQLLLILTTSMAMVIIVNLIINFLTIPNLIFLILRLWILNIVFSWFFLNTSPNDLMKALIWFKIPYRWAWTISGTFRFIHLFKRETEEIISAQLVRGIPLDGTIIERINHVPSIIIPLVIRTNTRTQQLAEALFARGWLPVGKKTFLHQLNIKTCNNTIFTFLFFIFSILAYFLDKISIT